MSSPSLACPSGGPAGSWASTARRSARPRRGRTTRRLDRRHRRARQPVRPLRLPPDHGAAAGRRLGGERQAGRADLAAGGAEGSAKQPKRGRLWLNDGSCIRLRPERPNHVWSYDFVEDRTHDGRKFRMLNVIDEFTRECLAIRVARKLKSIDVIDVLSDLFILRGVPGHIRSDNGPEFVAKAVRDVDRRGRRQDRLHRARQPVGERLLSRASTAQLRDELLDGEIFYTLREAQVVIESWRRHYNRASEHPSCYVIEEKRLCWPGCDPAGYLGFCRARSVIDRAADVVSAARAKIHGPSGRGWIASISPASAASRSVLGAICRSFAALLRLSHGSIPSSAGLNTGMR